MGTHRQATVTTRMNGANEFTDAMHFGAYRVCHTHRTHGQASDHITKIRTGISRTTKKKKKTTEQQQIFISLFLSFLHITEKPE